MDNLNHSFRNDMYVLTLYCLKNITIIFVFCDSKIKRENSFEQTIGLCSNLACPKWSQGILISVDIKRRNELPP